MEMVGVPQEWLVLLLQAATGGQPLSVVHLASAKDQLARLTPKTSHRASLDKPTGTAEIVQVEKTLEQASSVSATPSWTVSHG